ncbi:unnamed protein product [Trichogramma brassicae]|uniref:Uncharacterized protein n=1 Tax=Trichogramma brassicae TaxID=86971 RepID=A0A6H5IXS7_9HYME|nr:unnamed protein product [Trichogramma brassicae]
MVQDNHNRINRCDEKINWKIEEKSHEFLRKLNLFIRDYQGQLPNLRDIFRREAIDWPLMDSVDDYNEPNLIIDFVINTGYKDEPDFNEDGKPLLRRNTPIHRAMKEYRSQIVPDLFRIYDKFDVNYVDEDGYTHFHIACKYGCLDVVKKFLDLGQDPNCIVPETAIEWLLTETLNSFVEEDPEPFIDFVINSGYKDEPDVGEDGKPWLYRTTTIHHVARQNRSPSITFNLFKIYDRFDVNYTDKNGLTHFHIACVYGCDEIVKKFLELGQDHDKINCLLPKIGDSLLHLALEKPNKEGAKLLLRSGANPNLANKDGLTPLHIMCVFPFRIKDLAEIFLEINNDKSQTLQIDARDKNGDTPLHIAMQMGCEEMIEFLLRNGADPNIVNNEGSTPLHYFVTSIGNDRDDLLKMFFKINGALNQPVQVDTKDKLGRTPLQLAVVNLAPDYIDVLLDYGADPSCFVFPSESHFTERYKCRNKSFQFKLNLVSSLLIIIEHLERRGYQMDRSDALTFMQLFAKLSLFEKSADLEKYLVNDDEFAIEAEVIMITSSLSLYDLIQLGTEEAAKLILTHEDYYDLANSKKIWRLPGKGPAIEACARCLCERVSRGFFRRWALDPLLELTKYKLPILCCEIIIDKLMNEDLSSICLAAASGTHDGD